MLTSESYPAQIRTGNSGRSPAVKNLFRSMITANDHDNYSVKFITTSIRKPEGTKPLWRARRRRQNLKMDLNKDTQCT